MTDLSNESSPPVESKTLSPDEVFHSMELFLFSSKFSFSFVDVVWRNSPVDLSRILNQQPLLSLIQMINKYQLNYPMN